jgi:alanine racemase
MSEESDGMIELALLVAATDGTVWQQGSAERFGAFASDAREVEGGELFVAVRGVHADGHDFVVEAIAHGAGGALVEAARLSADDTLRERLAATGATIIAVADVRRALRDYAAAVLRAWHPKIIAVAGSAGKTTTKEAIATILSHHASTFRSWRNYNDLLGLPLSLGGLESHHEFAVLEMANDFPGELAALAEIAPPDIAVILNTHATHLDGLGSQAGVVEALATLPRSMHAGQTVVLNGDDDHLRALGATLQQQDDAPRVVWFGDHDDALINTHGRMHRPPGSFPHLGIVWPIPDGTQGTLFLHLLGGQWNDAVKAALTVTQLLDIDYRQSAQGLSDFTSLPGRMRRLDGVQGITLLDDSHNAIPAAMLAALDVLHGMVGAASWRRQDANPVPGIAVLGDMTHLGDDAEQYHVQVGMHVAEMQQRMQHGHPKYLLWLITRGALGENIARAAREAGMPGERIIVTHTAEDAANAVLGIAAQSSTPPVVLIKGSPEMRMEAVTERLLADPASAPEVLDRQRSIWRRAIVGELHRPTWLEIDLHAIGGNARAIKQIVGPEVALMATLKADAYGHGALKVARTVLRNGATWLGVATVSEAQPLRQAGITAPILVYGYVPPWQARDAVAADLRATVYADETAHALARTAVALGRTAQVHVKIDSGMGRLGLRAEDIPGIVAFVRGLHALPGIEVEGIYTHFAAADEMDLSHARLQLARFQAVLAALDADGLRPPLVHAANSAATLLLPEARFDLVRPGIILYGLAPSEDVPLPAGFRPALTFKTQIAQVKTIPPGESISYGRTYTTTEAERVAVLPVGYADGFRRGPANWGSVLIHGQHAPIRGRVCMDQTIVSVQHIPGAHAGDEVVLIGTQCNARITAEDVAAHLGTHTYEVVAALLARVPRVNG